MGWVTCAGVRLLSPNAGRAGWGCGRFPRCGLGGVAWPSAPCSRTPDGPTGGAAGS
ncbi:hypothetical protein STTU_3767 [Streptomyces sp. Tu6071]|nr:hypothetical protein STTU_3767 [Streptomyces sp. Tu6071]